jgi:hypothetical protein
MAEQCSLGYLQCRGYDKLVCLCGRAVYILGCLLFQSLYHLGGLLLTLLQMRTLVYDWVDDPNGSYFTSSTVNLRLNLAMWELQKRLISANQEFFLSCVKTDTVSAQQAYALPSDFLQLVRLEWYETGTSATSLSNKIEFMTPNQRDLIGEVTGDPQYWTFSKNNILLWPIPDRIVEVHLEYNYQTAFMSSDSDIPDMPLQYHEYIPIIATRDCLIKDGRPIQPIETKLQEFETLLKQIAVQRRADSPRMVRQTAQEWSW